MRYGLGRIHLPDARDHAYLIADVLPRARSLRPWRYWWDNGWWGDQGETPQCVAYAWEHWLDDGPVLHPKRPVFDPALIYQLAQENDETPGVNYEGTSVRGGAKALAFLGKIGEYRWAWNVETVANAVLQLGPVVVGTNFYQAMFEPDSRGFIRPGGALVGGHAYVLSGVNVWLKRFRMKNSWGRGWGQAGHAWITFDDFARLLSEDGEACLATEVKG